MAEEEAARSTTEHWRIPDTYGTSSGHSNRPIAGRRNGRSRGQTADGRDSRDGACLLPLPASAVPSNQTNIVRNVSAFNERIHNNLRPDWKRTSLPRHGHADDKWLSSFIVRHLSTSNPHHVAICKSFDRGMRVENIYKLPFRLFSFSSIVYFCFYLSERWP